jgi:hypothetical protein
MSDPQNPSSPPAVTLERRVEALETALTTANKRIDQTATSTRVDELRDAIGERFDGVESRLDDLEDEATDVSASTAELATTDGVQTLKTRYLCHCGNPAILTFAFPGEAKQARCHLHESGIVLRKEFEPGRTHVASVERFPEIEAPSVVD